MKEEIIKEILEKLTIQVNTDSPMWEWNTIEVTVTLQYDGEIISEAKSFFKLEQCFTEKQALCVV